MGERLSHLLSPLFHPRSDPPNPTKASVTLPPEVIDKILEYIHADGWGSPTLVACASVATWWMEPSQRGLFSSVKIHPNNYKRWMNGVVLSGSKDHLLGYVRSLSEANNYRMQDLAQHCGEYLSVLHNLRSLELCNITVERISESEFHTCFSAFRDTLTYLALDSFTASVSAFVILVDYFPNVTTLRLRSFDLEPDEGPVPSLRRPLRGKLELSFDYHGVNSPEFIDRFAKLELEYEELVIESPSYIWKETEILKKALRISTGTVKFLRVNAEIEPGTAATICDFRQLQELELKMDCPSSSHKVPLSSITSTELRKITFLATNENYWWVVRRPVEDWALVDDQLCELVDRLCAMGYRHTLKAELRFFDARDDPKIHNYATFLPKFREKGTVTVVNATHDSRLLHSPTRDR